MICYADTSFLFALFVSDAHSRSAVALRSRIVGVLRISLLGELELINAICLAVFQKRVSAEDADTIYKLIDEDVQTGALKKVDVDWRAAFAAADKLARTFTRSGGSRSLDVLQVAIASTIGADTFLSFDLRQRALAMNAGLKLEPAELSNPP